MNNNDDTNSGTFRMMKNINADDRPREKAVAKGFEALTNAELLAILMGSGSRGESVVDLAQRILMKCDSRLSILGKRSIGYLKTNFKGVGDAKAITILAAMELGRRYLAENSDTMRQEKVQITNSDKAYELMRFHLQHLTHEEFWVVALSASKQIIGKYKISSGGLSATVVDPKMVMRVALDNVAHSILLYHNHPSGNTNPSQSDDNLTNKIAQCGKILDIEVVDHIIVSENGYYSYATEGKLS